MGLFDQYVIPPSAGQLEVLRYLLVMTYAVHLPYLGIVIGATVLSLGFNARDRDIANPTFARISKDLMDMVVASRAVVFVLGMLPLVVLWMIYGQWLQGLSPSTFSLLPVGAVLMVVGLMLVTAYQASLRPDGGNSANNFGIGTLGLLLLLLGSYVVIGSIARFNDPERWILERSPLRLMLSFNIIWRYAFILVSGVAFAGCGLLFFSFSWPGCKPIDDEKYATFLKNVGAGTGLAATLLIPLMMFFYAITTPLIAASGALYGIAVAMVAILFLIFVFLYGAILSARPRFGWPVFVLFLMVFGLSGTVDQLTLVNATQEHSVAQIAASEERRAQIQLEREAERGSAVVDVARGQEVFETICMTCHRMDEKLVGPPLNTVLPKYASMDELVSFIQSPSKKDPEYPPMPAPGLPLADVKSVAAFLLGESGQETTPEVPEH